jgi:hypothetical protein
MTDPQASLPRKSNNRHHVRRPLGVHMVVLVLLVASCIPPYPQGTYQQGPYPQGPYQQGQYGYSSSAGYEMRVVYQPPTKKPEREEIRKFLQATEAFDKVARGLNQIFDFPQEVTILWTECGAVNASWDGQGNIVMCYEMAEFLKALFIKKTKDQKQLRVAVMSSLMFVFLHELGHGLIAMYKLPSVGREEDAADQLAGLVLIATGDAGLEIAINGAQFFRLLALSGSKTPFFDEHSLDAQRYYNLMCLVYGSSPDRLGSLVGNAKLPASRARRCPREYSKINTAWTSLLSPHMRTAGNQDVPAQTNRGYSGDSDNPGYSKDSGEGDYPRNSGGSRNSGSGSSSSEWSCRAVGSYAPPSSTGGPDYSDTQNVDVTKWGRTRDEAGFAALDACSGLLNLSANPTLSPGSLVLESCRVLTCSR